MMIFDGRSFLAFAGVDAASASFDVVWHRQAAADGYRNVTMPLRRDTLADAQRLVEHLLSQMAMGLPASEGSAQELFAMIEPRASAAVDRPDYDGITPADALATDQGKADINESQDRSFKPRSLNDMT